jgi:hypothetical protein
MSNYEIDNIAEIVPTWTSYIGVVTGMLNAVGTETDVVDVGGYTGYAFIVNVAESDTCPSGPTAHSAFLEFPSAIENSFGWKVKFDWPRPSYPSAEKPTKEDLKRAESHFNYVKTALRETGRPVAQWGIGVPEFGIINGYSKDSYIVSTFEHLNIQKLKYDALQAPGGLGYLILEEESAAMDGREKDKQAIHRAIKMAEGKYREENYVQGPDAFEKWATILEEGTDKSLVYHGNAYVGECTLEGFRLAGSFLNRLAQAYHQDKQGEPLAKASSEYHHAEAIMKEFTEVFPFAFEGDIPGEKRKRGASILRRAKSHVVEAVSCMKKALDEWK